MDVNSIQNKGKRNDVSVRIKLDWKGKRELQRYLEKTMPRAFEASLEEALKDTAYDGKKRAFLVLAKLSCYSIQRYSLEIDND